MICLPDPTPTPTPSPTPSLSPASCPAGGKRGSKRRRCLLAVLVLAGVWWLVTQGFLGRMIVQSFASAAVGTPVGIGSISLGITGRSEFRNITVAGHTDSSQIASPAREFLAIDSLTCYARWWRAFSGSDPILEGVRAEGLRLRVSQSVESGALNLPRFAIVPSASSSDPTIPSVEIRGGIIELGEHQHDGSYTTLQALRVSGGVYRGERPGESVFRLVQEVGSTTSRPASPRFEVSGSIDAERAQARITGVSLGGIDPSSVPSRFRELFRVMDLRGTIGETRFTYRLPKLGQTFDPALAVEASMDVDGVAVTLPLDRFSTSGGSTAPRMTDVYGKIRVAGGQLNAKFGGLLEDLPYTVDLHWNGPTLDAPFECVLATRQFELERTPKLLPFLPPKVHERLAMFSSPTALLDSRVVVSRAATSGPTGVAGTIEFTSGTAAFVRFPYEFSDMRGLLEFDDTALRIVRIEGTADSGATIRVSGNISPLTDEAAVSLDIAVKDIVVDDALAAALGPRRRGVIEALFNQDRYAELLAQGLVVTPEEASLRAARLDEARIELAAARAQPGLGPNDGPSSRRISRAEAALADAALSASVPGFAPGAKGNVVLKLETPFGRDMPWTQIINITIPRGMMLPKRFPYPVIASNVILQVDDTTLTLVDGVFEGLAGGRASVRASADFSSAPSPGSAPERGTEVTINASRIPLDPFLLFAIPAKDRTIAAPDQDGNRRTLGQVLNLLNLSGEADATVVVRDNGPGESSFHADVTFDQTRCVPTTLPHSPVGVALGTMAGELKVNDDKLSLTLRALATAADEPPDTPSRGNIAIRTEASFGDVAKGIPASVHSTVTLDSFDAAIHIEPAIAAFAPAAAAAIAELRTRYEPRGLTTLVATVNSIGDQPTKVDVQAKAPTGFRVAYKPLDGQPDVPGVDIVLGPMAGALDYQSTGGYSRVGFSDIAADLSASDGSSAGSLELSGHLLLTPGGQGPESGELRFKATSGRFESPISAAVIADRLRGGFAEFYDDRSPAGLFNADVRIFRAPGAAASDGWDVRGSILPLSLSARTDLSRLDCPSASGTIRFTRDSGSFESLRLSSSDWNANINGGWSLLPAGGSDLLLKINGESTGVPASLKGLLPPGVRTTMDDLRIKTDGKLVLSDLELGMTWAPATPTASMTPSVTASGVLAFEKLDADVGVLVTGAQGRATFDSRSLRTTSFKVGVDLLSAKAANVSISSARAVALSGSNPGEVLVPSFQADCHKGRVSGEADLKPISAADPDGPKAFSTRIDLSGVELEGVLRDFGTNSKPPEGGRSALIDAGVAMGGITGDPTSRRGRGTLYLGGGQVLSLPVMLPLMQVSSFQLPSSEILDNARSTFFIEGTMIGIERLSVYSPSVELRGFGLLLWPSLDLDLVINSKAVTRMPLITRIVEGLRDEFVTTSVKGTPTKPSVSLTPFRGASGALSGLFGTESRRDKLMRRLEAASLSQDDRLRIPVETKPR